MVEPGLGMAERDQSIAADEAEPSREKMTTEPTSKPTNANALKLRASRHSMYAV